MVAGRGTFVAFQHGNSRHARAFRALNQRKGSPLNISERSFIDPLKNKNDAQIRGAIRSKLDRCDSAVILIGKGTKNSEWVKWERGEMATRKIQPLLILTPDAKRSDIPSWLRGKGNEVMEWAPEKFQEGIERSRQASGHATKATSGGPGGGAVKIGGGSC